jgi:hypothetical protein
MVTVPPSTLEISLSSAGIGDEEDHRVPVCLWCAFGWATAAHFFPCGGIPTSTMGEVECMACTSAHLSSGLGGEHFEFECTPAIQTDRTP